MHEKVLKIIIMLEDGVLNIEKTRMLLESIAEQSEADNNEEALKFAQKASSMIPESGDTVDSCLMDTLGDLVWAIAKQDIDPIEKFLVERHESLGYTVKNIQKYRKAKILDERLSLDRFRLIVWMKSEKDGINEVAFLDDDRKPHVIDCRPLVDPDADEEAQFKTIREELKAMGI